MSKTLYEESLESDVEDLKENYDKLAKAVEVLLTIIDKYGLCEGHGDVQAAFDYAEHLL